MGDIFRLEASRFQEAFHKYKKHRIVLYGIGRRTSSIIAYNKDFCFVGLMDRDPENIGKEVYGLPIVSLAEAEKISDIIIISSPETYWDIIYRRIECAEIPVYFLNGEKAVKRNGNFIEEDCPYWNRTIDELRNALLAHDVISFDLFDTLVVRAVVRPEDVFSLLDQYFHSCEILPLKDSFVEMRNVCMDKMRRYCTLDDLYVTIANEWNLPEGTARRMRDVEITLEIALSRPRKAIVNLLHEMQRMGKEIYILSDMYLPRKAIQSILCKNSIDIPDKQLIISNEIKAEKNDGTLWEIYKKNIVKKRTAIHVGDNCSADIKKAKKNNIDAFYVMSIPEMLRHSSLKKLEELIHNAKDSLIIGMIISRLFNNPFSICKTKGKVIIRDFNLFGYCFFGGIVYTFIEWIVKKCNEFDISRLLFVSRDGYLLKQAYIYYMQLHQETHLPIPDYLYISRRVVGVASISTQRDLDEWLSFPYIGNFKDFLVDRLSIHCASDDIHKDKLIQLPKDLEKIRRWIYPYMERIWEIIKTEKTNYLKYLRTKQMSEADAIVDTGFYGTIQDKLCKLTQTRICGFYFNCDLTEANQYRANKMYPCFQYFDDKAAKMSQLRRWPQFIESMFTAPYGMVLGVDSDGNRKCAPNGMNQFHFSERLKINEGIKCLIEDMWKVKDLSNMEVGVDWRMLADSIFGIFMRDCDLDDKIKNIFVWDDALVQRRQNPIFA